MQVIFKNSKKEGDKIAEQLELNQEEVEWLSR
jgi:hypothetical protein